MLLRSVSLGACGSLSSRPTLLTPAPGPNSPKPRKQPDPEGPIEPLDLPELTEFPVDVGNSEVRIDQGEGVTVNTEVGGVPLEVKLDREGVNIQPAPPETRPAPAPR